MSNTQTTSDEAAVRVLVERWAEAVRRKDLEGILADHSSDIVMFDVPPPLQSIGLGAYRKTWDVFFSWSQNSGVFDIDEMTVTAGSDVAFVVALMHCAGNEPDGQRVELRFRLTVGLRKVGARWTVVHEHHSIPSE